MADPTFANFSPQLPFWFNLTLPTSLLWRWMPQTKWWEQFSPSVPSQPSSFNLVPTFLAGILLMNTTIMFGDRELLTVKLTLQEWRQWLALAEQPFIV